MKKIIPVIAAAVICTATLTCTAAPLAVSTISANAASYKIEGLPMSDDEHANFLAAYGRLSVHNDCIVYCDSVNFSAGDDVVLEQSGTAQLELVDSYSMPAPPNAPIEGKPVNMIYIYKAVSAGTVAVNIYQGRSWQWDESKLLRANDYYKIADDLAITQTNGLCCKYPWLPDNKADYDRFIADFGNVSLHGKYIVYCDTINYSLGMDVVIEQTGTAEIVELGNYSIVGELMPPGSPSDTVRLYEAKTPGSVRFSIYHARPWEVEKEKELRSSEVYNAADDLSLSRAVMGDLNGDGELTVADAVMLQKWLLGAGDAPDILCADLCRDDKLDVFDMIVLRNELVNSANISQKYDILENKAMRGSRQNDMERGLFTAADYDGLCAIISENELNDGQKLAEYLPENVSSEYFADKSVIVVYNDCGAGNKKLRIDDVRREGDAVTVYTTTLYPEVATPDMAYYRAVIGVDKSMLDGAEMVTRIDNEIREGAELS